MVITAHLITFNTSVAALAVDTELAVGARLVMHTLVHVLRDKILSQSPHIITLPLTHQTSVLSVHHVALGAHSTGLGAGA